MSHFPTFEAFYLIFMWLSRILRFVFMSFMFPIIIFWVVLFRIRLTFGGIILGGCFSVREVLEFQYHIGHKRILSLFSRLLNPF